MDGKTLYYLMWHQPAGSDAMLWRMMVDSGKSELVFPGIPMTGYDVSPDGRQVVYSTAAHGEKSQLWVAPMDRNSSPKKISASGEMTPRFGPNGDIIFQVTEGTFIYLERMNQDGSGRKKVVPYPIIELVGISPGRKWLTAVVPLAEGKAMVPMTMAIPLDGGSPQRLCASYCGAPQWSSSGKFLFIPVEAGSETTDGRSLAIPVGPGESLPPFPPGGIEPGAQPSVMPGSQSVNRYEMVPGEDLTHFAYVKTTAHRNLYRVSLP
jgi:Tol biopolymer transport system component